MAESSLSKAAALARHLAEPARLRVLDLLAGEGAMTVSDLAARLGVGMPALSNHLARLRRDAVVTTVRDGRHTYYALANPGLKGLLDVLHHTSGGPAVDPDAGGSRAPSLREARTCYDHLAGRLGVRLLDMLLAHDVIAAVTDRPGSMRDGPAAVRLHRRLSLDTAALHESRRRYAFACLDWTERRPHLGGALAAGIAIRLFELAWVERVPGGRALRVTARGRRGLAGLAAELGR